MGKITYTKQGEYLLPDLGPPKEKDIVIGKYGRLRKAYLKNHRRIIYTNLLTNGKLLEHLAEVDKLANDMLERLKKQMAEQQGITEDLKEQDQMAWVGAVNNIKACAEEVVSKEINYA